jgi:hypothetical protein
MNAMEVLVGAAITQAGSLLAVAFYLGKICKRIEGHGEAIRELKSPDIPCAKPCRDLVIQHETQLQMGANYGS